MGEFSEKKKKIRKQIKKQIQITRNNVIKLFNSLNTLRCLDFWEQKDLNNYSSGVNVSSYHGIMSQNDMIHMVNIQMLLLTLGLWVPPSVQNSDMCAAILHWRSFINLSQRLCSSDQTMEPGTFLVL